MQTGCAGDALGIVGVAEISESQPPGTDLAGLEIGAVDVVHRVIDLGRTEREPAAVGTPASCSWGRQRPVHGVRGEYDGGLVSDQLLVDSSLLRWRCGRLGSCPRAGGRLCPAALTVRTAGVMKSTWRRNRPADRPDRVPRRTGPRGPHQGLLRRGRLHVRRRARNRRLLPQERKGHHCFDGSRDSGRGDRAEAGVTGPRCETHE